MALFSGKFDRKSRTEILSLAKSQLFTTKLFSFPAKLRTKHSIDRLYTLLKLDTTSTVLQCQSLVYAKVFVYNVKISIAHVDKICPSLSISKLHVIHVYNFYLGLNIINVGKLLYIVLPTGLYEVSFVSLAKRRINTTTSSSDAIEFWSDMEKGKRRSKNRILYSGRCQIASYFMVYSF